jgi:hypothetical protein
MTTRLLGAVLTAFLAGSLSAGTSVHAKSAELESSDVMIPSSDPGIQLFVRNKHPVGMRTFSPEKTLLYVHGATYPSETAFDLPIEGVSMMDLIASRGYDVYLVDIRG